MNTPRVEPPVVVARSYCAIARLFDKMKSIWSRQFSWPAATQSITLGAAVAGGANTLPPPAAM